MQKWSRYSKVHLPPFGLSRPNRSPTTRSNHSTTTRFQPEPKVLSVGDGFPFSKTDTGGSSGEFASPKPVQPEPDRSYKKSNQILKKQARSDEISTKSTEISTRSGYIWWDLAKSGQTQQFLAKKKCRFQKKSSFQREFSRFR